MSGTGFGFAPLWGIKWPGDGSKTAPVLCATNVCTWASPSARNTEQVQYSSTPPGRSSGHSVASSRAWMAALEAAPTDPAAQLAAIIDVNFSDAVCAPNWLSAWLSFWMESQSRPLYVEICSGDDVAYLQALEGICARLIEDYGYSLDPVRAARLMRVTIEAVWVDLMFPIKAYDIAEAKATVHFCAAALFPRHFDTSGLIRH